MNRPESREKITMVRSITLGLVSFGLTATMILATATQGSALFA
jgi:hypothetical protein